MLPSFFFPYDLLTGGEKMATHHSNKGKVSRKLLRGCYYNVPSPWGTVQANVEVYLHVQVRVDQDGEDHGERGSGQSGDDRYDVPGIDGDEVCRAIAGRIADLVESATPASAPLERIAQCELFEGLESTGKEHS